MFRLKSSGSFSKTEGYLRKLSKGSVFDILEKGAQAGITALARATPRDSGDTARSWHYEIERKKSVYTIHWLNLNIVNGVPIAIILQYGHGTATGGWVEGIDYVNPALAPVFEQILDDIWKAVTSA